MSNAMNFHPFQKSKSSKCGQEFLATTKQSATDAINTTSKRAIPKTAEAAGDLVGKEIAKKITEPATKSNCDL